MRWIEKSIGSIARQADVSEEDLAIVNYGFVQGLKSVTGILLSVLLGILMRIPLSCILFLGFYIALRIYAGGYHAESEKQCAVLSAVSIAAAYAWIKWGSGTAAAMAFTGAACTAVLIVLSPVDNPGHSLEAEEKRYYRRISYFISAGAAAAGAVSLCLGWYQAARSMLAALALTACSVTAGYIKYKRKIAVNS